MAPAVGSPLRTLLPKNLAGLPPSLCRTFPQGGGARGPPSMPQPVPAACLEEVWEGPRASFHALAHQWPCLPDCQGGAKPRPAPPPARHPRQGSRLPATLGRSVQCWQLPGHAHVYVPTHEGPAARAQARRGAGQPRRGRGLHSSNPPAPLPCSVTGGSEVSAPEAGERQPGAAVAGKRLRERDTGATGCTLLALEGFCGTGRAAGSPGKEGAGPD